MQYLENDMDALFQQAAEHYPLNHGKDEWQTVLAIIKEQERKPVPADQEQKGYVSRLLITAALLLLAASLFFFAAVTMQVKKTADDTVIKNLFLPQEKTQSADTINKQLNKINLLTAEDKKDIYLPGSKTKARVKNKVADLRWSAIPSKAVTHNTLEENEPTDNVKVNDAGSVQPLPVTAVKLLYEKKHAASTIVLPAAYAYKAAKRNSEHPNKNFYLGIAAGFDFNKGASMNYRTAGFKAGILVGRQFKDRLAVETGLSFVSKTYESQGRHFNMKKVHLLCLQAW